MEKTAETDELPHPRCIKAMLKNKSVTTELVTEFLKRNTDYLEDFVYKHVSIEDMERLLIRKSHRRTHNQLLELSDPELFLSKDALDLSSSSNPMHDEAGKPSLKRSESKRLSLSRWKFCVHADKRKMLQQLTKDITNYQSKVQVLLELSDCIYNAVNADHYNFYFMNDDKTLLYHCYPGKTELSDSQKPEAHFPVKEGYNIPAYVASKRKTVLITELGQISDSRFPFGVGKDNERVNSVLCLPIFQSDGEIVGVLELLKTRNLDETQQLSLSDSFAEEDEEIASSYLVWGGIAVYYAEMYVGLRQQKNLNGFLLDVIKSLFKDISVDRVVSRIMGYAKQLVNADRAALFMIDSKSDELYAQVFDQGNEKERVPEIRFPMSKGIAGHVATTGEILNIKDAYQDDRFNREVDAMTGYKTHTLLCMPIFIKDRIIGVVQLVNKLGGTFNKKDEEAFQMFAIYCGLALHNAKLYERLWKSEQRYKVAVEILSYHATPKEEDITEIQNQKPNDLSKIEGFEQYSFFGWYIDPEKKVRLVLDMFNELFQGQWVETSKEGHYKASDITVNFENHKELRGRSSVDSLPEPAKSSHQQLTFDSEVLIRFFLTIRRNYRDVPYHNWNHAFEVARAMFCVLKNGTHCFTLLEALGLFVACVCHDVDHRGKTNSYMVRSASPLGEMFATSTMEQHHFKHTVTILQQEKHNIFSQLCTEDFKQVLKVIRYCIISTDLVQFFKNKETFTHMLNNEHETFSWEEEKFRDLTMAVAMTSCDLTSGFTTWEGSQELACHIMEEFWQQGDDETQKGLTSLDNIEPILDRRQKFNLPSLEVGFIANVCLPCYKLLAIVIIEADEIVKNAEKNLELWKAIAETTKTEMRD